MEFSLKNVGVVKNTTIKLDGLTIITGANNSGKSTVGKALYSTIEGLNNIPEKRELEIRWNFQRMHYFIVKTLSFDTIISYIDLDKIEPDNIKYFRMLAHPYRLIADDDILNEIISFRNFIQNINEEYILSILKPIEQGFQKKLNAYLKNFAEAKEQAIKYFEKIDLYIDDDKLEKFTSINLVAQFRKEFANQIAPMKLSKATTNSSIVLSKNGEVGCSFTIKGNKSISNSEKSYSNTFFSDVVLIDNPFIVDQLSDDEFVAHRISYFDSVHSHTEKLLNLLSERETESIIEREINERQYDEIMRDINSVVPGNLIQEDGQFYYVESNYAPLRVENLATGSKVFSIIKLLLQKGKIGINTMLILDEPETHLHPEWQNRFAEVIVLLVKHLDVKVLLTTHSVNFALAIETFSKQYGLTSNTNFYKTKFVDDRNYLIEYERINDRMNELYADFVRPFSHIKALNTKLTYDEE